MVVLHVIAVFCRFNECNYKFWQKKEPHKRCGSEELNRVLQYNQRSFVTDQYENRLTN